MKVRQLDRASLAQVATMDISEEGSVNYRIADGVLAASHKEHQRPVLSAEEWQANFADWLPLLEAGGVALGAFKGERLVGVAILRHDLEPGLAQLAVLYVDRRDRRTGVGSALVQAVEDLARSHGAVTLYVSAIPSDSAVPFYLARGFRPVDEPHPELFALEPDDIHMSKRLESA